MQHTIAATVVGIPCLGLIARRLVVPFDEVVQEVIGERGRIGATTTTQGARADIAPRIIGGGIDFARFAGAGRTRRVDADHLVRRGAIAGEKELPCFSLLSGDTNEKRLDASPQIPKATSRLSVVSLSPS